jgi:hypothetical protein
VGTNADELDAVEEDGMTGKLIWPWLLLLLLLLVASTCFTIEIDSMLQTMTPQQMYLYLVNTITTITASKIISNKSYWHRAWLTLHLIIPGFYSLTVILNRNDVTYFWDTLFLFSCVIQLIFHYVLSFHFHQAYNYHYVHTFLANSLQLFTCCMQINNMAQSENKDLDSTCSIFNLILSLATLLITVKSCFPEGLNSVQAYSELKQNDGELLQEI